MQNYLRSRDYIIRGCPFEQSPVSRAARQGGLFCPADESAWRRRRRVRAWLPACRRAACLICLACLPLPPSPPQTFVSRDTTFSAQFRRVLQPVSGSLASYPDFLLPARGHGVCTFVILLSAELKSAGVEQNRPPPKLAEACSWFNYRKILRRGYSAGTVPSPGPAAVVAVAQPN